LKVPLLSFLERTSNLTLCFEPLTRTLFVVAVESALFIIVPSANVSNTNAFVEVPAVSVPPAVKAFNK